MKEKISLYAKRSFEILQKLNKTQKTSLVIISTLMLTGLTGVLVYADEGHDSPEPVVQQSEQVLVRKVGDVDPDAISQEGLSSFYGEIISKDIASINASREGVISSWNVSVGDRVSAGAVLGYVTVTGVSPEQQMALAEQQANALKAQLDLETANKISIQTESVFGQIAESLKSVANKQKSIYDSSTGTFLTTYQRELQAITEQQIQLSNKLQDFGNTALTEIYPLVSSGSTPFNQNFSAANLTLGFGVKNNTLINSYVVLSKLLAEKVRARTVTDQDIRNYLDKTIEMVEASVSIENLDLKMITESVKDLQTELRDISSELTQATIDTAAKERERSQIDIERSQVDIELSRSLVGFESDLSLKKLEQLSATERAKNEARGAQLLAQKLAVSAGGVIPILAAKSGVVATIEKNVGEYITISDRIGFISNANPRKNVRFSIPASWKDISKGDTLLISWRPEYSMGSAVITGISTIIDERGGYQAEAVISQGTVFPVGASVRIIPENSKKGVFVNRKAVVFEGVQPYVWIITESDAVRKQEVKIGRGLGEYVEILSGLEREFSYLVILDPLVQINSGMMLSEILKTEPKVESATPVKIQDESQPHGHDE